MLLPLACVFIYMYWRLTLTIEKIQLGAYPCTQSHGLYELEKTTTPVLMRRVEIALKVWLLAKWHPALSNVYNKTRVHNQTVLTDQQIHEVKCFK